MFSTYLLSVWSNLCKCSPCTYIRGPWGLSTMELFSPLWEVVTAQLWEYANSKPTSYFPPSPNYFYFLVLLFMSNVGQCPHPPPCILCRNLWRLEVLFRGMFGGKGAGESPFWKAKSECERQKQGYFLVQRNMIHTSHPDNRPPCDKYTLLSLALDFPHISLFY